jgi:hypothetical protein
VAGVYSHLLSNLPGPCLPGEMKVLIFVAVMHSFLLVILRWLTNFTVKIVASIGDQKLMWDQNLHIPKM